MIECLICHRKFKYLPTHLIVHDVTTTKYKQEFGSEVELECTKGRRLRAEGMKAVQSEGSKLMKGKTYEEIYGPERATKMKEKKSKARKGKTYEKLYGPERAAEAVRKNRETWARKRAEGYVSPLKDKNYEEIYGPEEAVERRAEISKSMMGKNKGKGRTGEVRLAISEGMKKYSRNNPELLKKRATLSSKSIKKKWRDPEYRRETIQKIVKGRFKGLTSYEQKCIDVCKGHDLPFKFVGDGRLIVGSGCPDFVDTLGLDPPLVIETYSRWWHRDGYKETRHKQLCVPRRNVLFLGDEDLRREDWNRHCASKIRWFLAARRGV